MERECALCMRTRLDDSRSLSGRTNVRIFGMQTGIIADIEAVLLFCRSCDEALKRFDAEKIWRALQVSLTHCFQCRHSVWWPLCWPID